MANYLILSNKQANDCIDFFMFPREWRIVVLLLKLGYHSEGAISIACSRCHRSKLRDDTIMS